MHNPEPAYTTCRRPGCQFPRQRRTHGTKRGRLQRECSTSCMIWLVRARSALEKGSADEAAELLRLSGALDARRRPEQPVPGLIKQD
jgi:hypothetical protein